MRKNCLQWYIFPCRTSTTCEAGAAEAMPRVPLGYGIALLSPPRKAPQRRCFFRGADAEPLAARTRSPRQGSLPLHDFDFACAALLVRCGKSDSMKRARSLRPRPSHFGEDHSSSSASVPEGRDPAAPASSPCACSFSAWRCNLR